MPIMKNWNGYEIYDEVARTEVTPIERGGTGATTKTKAANSLAVESLIGGTEIPEGADLNTYTTVGNYCSNGSTRTKTLKNIPKELTDGLTDGFQLKVRYVYGNYVSGTTYITQEITSNNGRHYTRGMAENSWGGWRRVYTTADTIAIEDGGTGANNSVDALHNLGIYWGTKEAPATGTPNTIYIQIN